MSSNPFARTVVGSGEGSRPKDAWRGQFDIGGNPVYEEIAWDNGKYVAPTTGPYTLQVVGYTRPELDEKYPNSKGEKVDKFGLELEIASDRGRGFRFIWGFQTTRITFGDDKFSPSNLGRIYMAAITGGQPAPKGTEVGLDDLFGKPFDAYVVESPDKNDKGMPKFAKVTADTIAPPSAGDNARPDPFAQAMASAELAKAS